MLTQQSSTTPPPPLSPKQTNMHKFYIIAFAPHTIYSEMQKKSDEATTVFYPQ